MGLKLNRSSKEPMSEINVTPFVDVMLVLLIIFMVTAPIVNHVIQVELPQDSYNKDVMKPLQEPLKLVIDKFGILYIGKTRIGDSVEEENQTILKDKVTQWISGKKQPWLVDVEADEKGPDEQADTLALDIDYIKALKIKEANLRRELKKIVEQKKLLKKRLINSL